MRLRNVPGAREAISESKYVLLNEERGDYRFLDVTEASDSFAQVNEASDTENNTHPETKVSKAVNTNKDIHLPINPSEIFGNENPLYLEIGMGKGRFIMDTAAANPDKSFIGIEKYSSVLIKAIKKREACPDMTNLYFMRLDAEYILDYFEKHSITGIYLNFSDPWPKDRHTERRLTSKSFLKKYEQLLVPGGTVVFKTDNNDLFDFSLSAATEAGWSILKMTRDLHHSEYAEGNIMTEYEEKFSSKGNNINMMTISKD